MLVRNVKNLIIATTILCIILMGLWLNIKFLNSSAVDNQSLDSFVSEFSSCENSLTSDFYLYCGYYTTTRNNKTQVRIPFVVIKKRELNSYQIELSDSIESLDSTVVSSLSNTVISVKEPKGYSQTVSGSFFSGAKLPNIIPSKALQLFLGDKPPLVALPGGPGSEAGIDSRSIQRWLGWYTRQSLSEALIVMDYRGLGNSQPTVNCETITFNKKSISPNKTALELSEFQKNNLVRFTQLASCWEKAKQVGYSELDFSAQTNAQDVLSLMQALGINKFNIYASSYGSRVATLAALMKPNLIGSMVLDSLHSLDNNNPNDWPTKFQQAFLNLFNYCKTYQQCSINIDSIKNKVSQIEENLRSKNIDANSITAHKTALLDSIFKSLYHENSIELIETLLLSPTEVLNLPSNHLPNSTFILNPTQFGDVVYFVNQCIDNIPFNLNRYEYNRGQTGFFSNYITYNQTTDFCRLTTRVNVLKNYRGLNISIPTVLLAGGLDPVTQVSQIMDASQFYTRSMLVIYPSAGHGLIDNQLCLDDALPVLLHNHDSSEFISDQCTQESIQISFNNND